MRTTIDIDASLLRELKARKERDGKTLGRLVSEMIARCLADEDHEVPAEDLRWPSKALHPRLDIGDKDALWRALDRS